MSASREPPGVTVNPEPENSYEPRASFKDRAEVTIPGEVVPLYTDIIEASSSINDKATVRPEVLAGTVKSHSSVRGMALLFAVFACIFVAGGLFVHRVFDSIQTTSYPSFSPTINQLQPSLEAGTKSDTLTVNAKLKVVNDAQLAGNLSVAGTAALQGDVSMAGNLVVKGSATTNSLHVTGDAVVGATLTALNVNATGSISVAGSVIASNLQGSFKGTFNGDGSQITNLSAASCADCLKLQKTSLVAQTGNVAFTGSLNVTGTSTLEGDLDVKGTASTRRLHIAPTENATDAFTIKDASGNTLFAADTINHQVVTGDLLPVKAGTSNAGSVTAGIVAHNLVNNTTRTYNDNSQWSVKGNDGFMRLVYIDQNTSDVNYVRCTDDACTSPVITTVASDFTNWTDTPSISLDNQGLAYITYLDYSSPTSTLHLIHCTDSSCINKTDQIIADDIDYIAAVATGTDGLARVAYGSTNNDISFVRCINVDCSSHVNSVVLGTAIWTLSIAVAANGNTYIAYIVSGVGGSGVITCNNSDCTANTNKSYPSSAYGQYISITTGKDNLPRIAFSDGNDGLEFVRCSTIDCMADSPVSIDANSNNYLSLALDGNDIPFIAYYDATGGISLAVCNDLNCSSSDIHALVADLDYPISLQLSPSNLPRIAYISSSTSSPDYYPLKFLSLGSRTGVDIVVQSSNAIGTTIGTSSAPFGQIFAQNISLQTASSTAALLINQQGVYGQGAGPIADFQINGASKFTIDQYGGVAAEQVSISNSLNVGITNLVVGSGRVGIGTASPQAAIDVTSPNASTIGQIVQAATGQTADLAQWRTPDGNPAVKIDANGQLSANACSECRIPGNIQSVVDLPFEPQYITVSGNYAYITSGATTGPTLNIYSLGWGTAQSTKVASIGTSSGGKVTIYSHYAIVPILDPYNGFEIYDITNPVAPSLVSTTVMSNPNVDQFDVKISGNYMYAVGRMGLEVFDISNVAAPTQVARLDLGTSGYGNTSILLNGTVAYVHNGYERKIFAVDISNPSAPVLTSTGSLSYQNSAAGGGNMVIVGNTLYASDSQGMDVFDITTPDNPIRSYYYGSTFFETVVSPSWDTVSSHRLAIFNNYLYELSPRGMEVYDFTSNSYNYENFRYGKTYFSAVGTNSYLHDFDMYNQFFEVVDQTRHKLITFSTGGTQLDSLQTNAARISGELTAEGHVTANAGISATGGIDIGSSKITSNALPLKVDNTLKGISLTGQITNYAPDPNFVSPIKGRGTGTVAAITGSTLTVSGKAAKITPNNDLTTVKQSCVSSLSTQQGTYTISFMAWTDSGSVTGLAFMPPSNRTLGSFTINATPQRFSYSFTSPNYYGCTAFEIGPQSGTTPVYIADLQIEPGETATSFFSGDSGPGYSWSGTVNNSTSVRQLGFYSDVSSYFQGASIANQLVAKQASGGSSDLLQLQNSSGTVLTKVDSTGQITAPSAVIASNLNLNSDATISINTTKLSSARLSIATGAVGNQGIIIRAFSGQTADLLQAQDSTGLNTLAKIDASGNLTAKSATFTGTLTMNGHIITANSTGTTTIAAGANAGTGATVSITGNDTSGTVTVTTGSTGAAAGVLATITFGSSYGSAPRVVLTPGNGNGAAIQYYVNTGTTSFTVRSNNAPGATTAYTYFYWVSQ